jgi:hypothetical protein
MPISICAEKFPKTLLIEHGDTCDNHLSSSVFLVLDSWMENYTGSWSVFKMKIM